MCAICVQKFGESILDLNLIIIFVFNILCCIFLIVKVSEILYLMLFFD